jgi:hypothetical protein
MPVLRVEARANRQQDELCDAADAAETSYQTDRVLAGRVPVVGGELRFVQHGVAPGQEVVAVAHGFSMLPLGRSRSVATLGRARSVDNHPPMPRECVAPTSGRLYGSLHGIKNAAH